MLALLEPVDRPESRHRRRGPCPERDHGVLVDTHNVVCTLTVKDNGRPSANLHGVTSLDADRATVARLLALVHDPWLIEPNH